MKERGSCGGNERANRVRCIVGGDGSRKVDECPVRMRAFQAIVRGKVVRKMHMIVSRCPFTLVMSLAAGNAVFYFLCVVHVRLCRKRRLSSLERRIKFVQRKPGKQSFPLLYQPLEKPLQVLCIHTIGEIAFPCGFFLLLMRLNSSQSIY